MIEVESYLRSGDGRFTPVADAQEAPGDPRYVAGAITLEIDHAPLLDTAVWDYVDQLWAYLSDMVGSLADQDEVSTYFPDQPIRLVFRRQGAGRLLVSVERSQGNRTASASEHELVAALQEKGSVFFRRMSELVPENSVPYGNALTRLMSYRPRQGARR